MAVLLPYLINNLSGIFCSGYGGFEAPRMSQIVTKIWTCSQFMRQTVHSPRSRHCAAGPTGDNHIVLRRGTTYRNHHRSGRSSARPAGS